MKIVVLILPVSTNNLKYRYEENVMKKRNKYNYKKLTITFNMDYDIERDIIEWMEKHKAIKNNFNTMVKEGLKLLIEKSNVAD
jgi:hypothetical protein